MIKYNEILAAVKDAFPGYKIDPSFGSISVKNALQSISFASRSDVEVAVFSSVSGLQVDLARWEKFTNLSEAIAFGLSIVIKPEDQPNVDLNSPDERSDDAEPVIIEAEIVEPANLINLS
jgi:hypothetical protein